MSIFPTQYSTLDASALGTHIASSPRLFEFAKGKAILLPNDLSCPRIFISTSATA